MEKDQSQLDVVIIEPQGKLTETLVKLNKRYRVVRVEDLGEPGLLDPRTGEIKENDKNS